MASWLFFTQWLHIDWVLVVVVAWLLIGVLGVLALRRFKFVATVLFPVGAGFSILLLAVALSAAFADPELAVLPLGLPQLPFPLRLDSLSAFFLMLIGGVSAGVSVVIIPLSVGAVPSRKTSSRGRFSFSRT